MGQTDMKALGEAIAVLDAQEEGGATLLTEDARRYYGQVVSLVTVRGLYEELAHAQAHGYAPPGKALVDEAFLREAIKSYPPASMGCRSDCPLHKRDGRGCTVEGTWCEPKLLAYHGLGEEGGDK